MSANEPVWPVYQVCAWLTPRMTNAFPLASTILVPLTRNPTAACAGAGEMSIEIRSDRSAAVASPSRWVMRVPFYCR